MIHLGPVTMSWHGLMIAVGIAAGAWLATVYARERGLRREVVVDCVLVIAFAGIVGSRLLYLAQSDASALLRPGDWVGSTGFSFYGALALGTAAVGLYLWRTGASARYLDALAAGFPLGMAVGRIGDIINGEHFGPATSVLWGVRNAHPDAEVPSNVIAYHSGGLYEALLGLAMLAIVWPLRHRFRRPTMLLWTVVALYAAGRFLMFFFRSDTDPAALGLNRAQLESLALLGIAAIGALVAGRPSISRGRVAVVAIAIGCAAITAAVAANHALAIQVVGAAGGAVTTTAGAALAISSWPHRRASEPRRLLAAAGFFLASIGVFTMLAGAGLYH